jgi:hypothetical protein
MRQDLSTGKYNFKKFSKNFTLDPHLKEKWEKHGWKGGKGREGNCCNDLGGIDVFGSTE